MGKKKIQLFKVYKKERGSELFSLDNNIHFLKNEERLKVIWFSYLKDLTINIHDFWNSEKSNAFSTTENYY